MLRNNQKKAIDKSIANNFKSGVHFHATGTGKSWIALELVTKYNNTYPNKNIIWLCEQKTILIEQFKTKTLKDKGYKNILKKFIIINFTEKKPTNWYNQINSATIWGKPLLIIINRSFLVSAKKYQKIKIDIGLIIHDECHSISNKTTKEFYNYILNKCNNISCLGFSATPNIEFKPFDNILSTYSIYDAYCDNVIVQPKIKWIKTQHQLDDEDIVHYCKTEINKLHYKKIIIWCGIIKYCKKLAELWQIYFSDFTIAIDTSEKNNDAFGTFDDFNNCKKNAILFCACKHREGSDIKNLDCCIFLDKVENRNPKTFIQCIGRVLRKDLNNQKKYGLIIDLKASSCLKICDRMNKYLNCDSNFPWDYKYNNITLNNIKITVNSLELKKVINNKKIKKNIKFTKSDIINKFVNKCENDEIYKKRLNMELDIIEKKNLFPYLIRAIEILELTNYIPHVTRGSCGSSLVCYLLGISNVDPIKYDINFARFLNDYRDNLPDIDLDFPHFLRDEVFLKLELNWPNQVARISNHVHWHEKSALREAIRREGYNQQIGKHDIHKFLKTLDNETRQKINITKTNLENTFRHYSLHCGGIVFFHDGVPSNLIFNKNNEKKTITQIICDKNDIAKNKNFKIDILSSRGISQLIDICGKNIDFSDCPYDEKTYKLLQSGNNIGITLAESPLMRKALLKIKPKNISDIAMCLAIIRPAAKDARLENNTIDFKTKFVYDDDAIKILSKFLNIDDDLADKFRRCISKNKWTTKLKEQYELLLENVDLDIREYITETLCNLRKYSFCKSHSYSYAQLVYKLAFQKAHNPKAFWRATLKHTNSSYRKWVHLYEARLAGIDVSSIINNKNDCSIYAKSRHANFFKLTKEQQLKKYGYWNMTSKIMYPNCYFYEKEDNVFYFGGLIASHRILGYSNKKTKIVSSICVGPGKYIEVIFKVKYYKPTTIGVKGRATLVDSKQKIYSAYIASCY
jgi:superfamily II DNA or RNA helicase